MSATKPDPKALRNALGTFTTGVTIITTRAPDGTPVGLTANSFNSVSLEPPLVLWSLAKTAMSLPVFTEAEHWNVHVLSMDQQDLSNRFASKGEDKFKDLALDQGVTNAPLIGQCSARFQCKTAFVHDGGDHIIFIGEVLDFDHSALPPLVFQSGQYALTARKPWEGVQLSQREEPLDCNYNEDLLGYLLGRAHFQMMQGMQKELARFDLSPAHFFAVSVLAIQGGIDLTGLNAHIEYTGQSLDENQMAQLVHSGLVTCIGEKYALTDKGHQASLGQIAQAKAIEDDLVDEIGRGDVTALKLLLKRLIRQTDPGLPDLWSDAVRGAKHD
ncbi:flavin reductase family protein [Shewanella submarina]|uniref:Flavin reductase n=1 Tax=Shewanella submarina TaxID=2016376 RepID=A0ABV7GHN6_9GAMM|nr:flavin reductase family protein [Shewanella submarina]MCL1037925.1 flavin reductase family protein [Shewanella submarina]